MLRIQLEIVRDAFQQRRGVRHEGIRSQGPAEKGIVHPEKEISQRCVPAQNDLVEGFAGVTQGENLHAGIIFRLEVAEHLFADGKGVMRGQRQRHRLLGSRGRGSRQRPATGQRHGSQQQHRQDTASVHVCLQQ